MLDQDLVKNIKDRIDHAKKILLVGHDNPRPDGDSLGAVLTLANYLVDAGRDFTAFAVYPVSERWQFLPLAGCLTSAIAPADWANFDLIIVLDFNELKNSRLATEIEQARARGVTLVNFDHHPSFAKATEGRPAELAIIDPTAAATCEILFHWLTAAAIAITPAMATTMLAGILFDTGHYTNLGTTVESLRVGAELLKRGASLPELTAQLWRHQRLPTLRLWGKVLERLAVDQETGLVSTAVFSADLKTDDLSPEDTDGIANFLNSLGDVKATLVLKEEAGGQVKGSLRTTQPDVDVAQMARQFGGGGHKKAAGFLVPGRIIKTERGWAVEKIGR